jgi:hypothetical protein
MKSYPIKIPKSLYDKLAKKKKALDISPKALRERRVEKYGTSRCYRSKLWRKQS